MTTQNTKREELIGRMDDCQLLASLRTLGGGRLSPDQTVVRAWHLAAVEDRMGGELTDQLLDELGL